MARSRFIRPCILAVIVAGATVFTLATPAVAAQDMAPYRPLPTDRGTVVVDHSLGFPRLLTDRGTPLRGIALAWDDRRTVKHDADVPSQQQLDDAARVYGMNALHVYVEKYDTNPDGSLTAGVNEAACDLLVDRCSKAGLYVVLTMGNGNKPNLNCYMPSMKFARSFWKVYAPRYSRRTNVIYEIQNEPGPEVQNIKAVMDAEPGSAPSPIPSQGMCSDASWTDEQYATEIDLYKIIRSAAPRSHIMLFSYCDFDNAQRALDGVAYATEHGVDWKCTSVAVHSYVEDGLFESTVRDFLASPGEPAALTCTEVNDSARVKDVEVYEAHHVSWLLFTWVENWGDCLGSLKNQFDEEGILWKPDYGSWPGLMPRPIPTANGPIKIDCAGNGSGEWVADIDGRHGTAAAPTTASIDLSGVVDPAPETVYQTERYGSNITYTIPGLKPSRPYTVRLHMSENYWNASRKRIFNVSINGSPVLTNFDLFAAAGAMHKAYVAQFTADADAMGSITVNLTSVVDNALIDGIEVDDSPPASSVQ